MPETPETARDIQEIRYRLEAIEATQLMLVRSEAREIEARLMELFEENRDLVAVYLAIDGSRTQSELLTELIGRGVKISQPTLSKRMTKLRDVGLIDLVPSSKRGDVYEKNRLIERVIQLSKKLK